MKTLFQRLKPEIKEPLLKDLDKYPRLIGGIIETLKTKKAITDLTMGEIGDIKSYSPTYITEIIQIWGMFEELE